MNHLSDILQKFKRTHLLVVGDLMLDRFIWGDVERISPEAPVPVLRVASENSKLGGAANVISNIRSLGGRVSACGIVGRDDAGKRILENLRRLRVSMGGVFSDGEFQTIQKTRIIARPRHQQIVRLDREKNGAIREPTLKKLRQSVLQRAGRRPGAALSAHRTGAAPAPPPPPPPELVERRKLICVVDPKKENYARYWSPSL